jgi:hypothetical protein
MRICLMLLVLALLVAPACGFKPGRPQHIGFVPHVVSVDVPSAIHAGVPAAFTLHLSSESYPELLNLDVHRLFAFNSSTSYMVGQADGSYAAGLFRGLMANPPSGSGLATDLGMANEVITLKVTFANAGNQVLYIGHAATEAQGGLGVVETVTNHGYPSESEEIEYLPVSVTVLP